jgi:hypothetical protein
MKGGAHGVCLFRMTNQFDKRFHRRSDHSLCSSFHKVVFSRTTRLFLAGLLLGSFASCVRHPIFSGSETTGLVDDLLTAAGVRKDSVPIEVQSSSPYPAAYISAARAVFASPGIHIYGNVRKSFGFSSSGEGHIDIILRLGNGQRFRAIVVDYFPRPIPPSAHGSIARYQSSANFSSVPSGLGTVIVRYHERKKSGCSYANLEGPEGV